MLNHSWSIKLHSSTPSTTRIWAHWRTNTRFVYDAFFLAVYLFAYTEFRMSESNYSRHWFLRLKTRENRCGTIAKKITKKSLRVIIREQSVIFEREMLLNQPIPNQPSHHRKENQVRSIILGRSKKKKKLKWFLLVRPSALPNIHTISSLEEEELENEYLYMKVIHHTVYRNLWCSCHFRSLFFHQQPFQRQW